MTLHNSFFALLAEKKPDFDPNSVTPGVIGFLATFLIIAVVVLLVTDMVRRVRRTQYRAEINQKLDAEAAAMIEQNGGTQSDGTQDAGAQDGDSPER